jgi:hypothetical protein
MVREMPVNQLVLKPLRLETRWPSIGITMTLAPTRTRS